MPTDGGCGFQRPPDCREAGVDTALVAKIDLSRRAQNGSEASHHLLDDGAAERPPTRPPRRFVRVFFDDRSSAQILDRVLEFRSAEKSFEIDGVAALSAPSADEQAMVSVLADLVWVDGEA